MSALLFGLLVLSSAGVVCCLVVAGVQRLRDDSPRTSLAIATALAGAYGLGWLGTFLV